MSTTVTSHMAFRGGWWVLWFVFTMSWALPLFGGVLWLLTYQPNPNSQSAQMVFHGMIVCILCICLCSIMNLWLYLWLKRSSRSTRWLSRGFVWSIVLTVIAAVWVRFLFTAMYDDLSEHGAFIGWFGYALLLVGVLSFNMVVFWRRTHMRRRRSVRSRSSSAPPV
jgi:Na+/H+-translocating membrane pyrophosphatase